MTSINEEILKTYKDRANQWKKEWWTPDRLLYWASSILTIALGINSIISKDGKVSEYIFPISLVVITLLSMYNLTKLYSDKTRMYYYISPDLRAATYVIKRAIIEKSSPDIEDVLYFANRAFSTICGVKCYVALKTLDLANIQSNEEISFNLHQGTDSDSQSNYEDKKFKISDFSSIESLYSNNAPIYVCNDIKEAVLHEQYRNPLIARAEEKKKLRYTTNKDGIRTGFARGSKFPLNYKSTMAVPIRGLRPSTPDEPKLIGILCIDAVEKNAFNHLSCEEIGLCFADILYAALQWNSISIPWDKEERRVS